MHMYVYIKGLATRSSLLQNGLDFFYSPQFQPRFSLCSRRPAWLGLAFLLVLVILYATSLERDLAIACAAIKNTHVCTKSCSLFLFPNQRVECTHTRTQASKQAHAVGHTREGRGDHQRKRIHTYMYI